MNNRRKGTTMLSRQMKLIKVLLKILGRKPPTEKLWRWTPLQTKFMIETEASPAEFYQTVRYCMKRGWIEKPKRGTYIRTKKGEALLEAL